MHSATTDTTVQLGPGTETVHSYLRYATVGRDCWIVNSVIEGCPEAPVVIGDEVTLVHCHIQSTGCRAAFDFGGWEVDQRRTHIDDHVSLSHAHLLNTAVGTGSQGRHVSIEYSRIGPHNALRPTANITRSLTAASCNLGSEISKTLLLGEGFVSEHGNSYLSLLAPGEYPILTADGREEILRELPNVTNIGAGAVFANYGGEPSPASAVEDSPESAKGTAVVHTAFVGINCRVINRYGQPQGRPSPFDLLRRQDLTILGFGSFVENKLGGRIPAFAYAGDLSPRQHQLGWVVAKKPGIILNFIKKMRQLLGDQAWRLQELVEGTLRLECQLLQEELAGKRRTFYQPQQLQDGLAIMQAQLQDGRWSMRDDGIWRHPWRFDHQRQQWYCDLG